MSRRRKSLAEDLTEVVAMLPWWLCLAAALGSYLLFSWVASLASASKGPMFGAVVGGLGTAAKVIAPIICVAAALISALKAARARKLVRSAREAAPQAAKVRRKAQRGTNAGQHFWGCSRFPQCKGTRSIA